MANRDPFESLLSGDFAGALGVPLQTKFNPNHDRLGRFASGPGSGGGMMAPDKDSGSGVASGGGGHKYEFSGRHLKLPGGAITSIPREGEGAVVFQHPKDGAFSVYEAKRGGYSADGNKYQKTFKDKGGLADWLTSQKMEYVGVESGNAY